MSKECTHDNITWLSGDENVIVTLNGAVAQCVDCGTYGYERG
jgi:hypothetical protein